MSKYLELDNKTIFIVTVYGTLYENHADGTSSYIAYTYDGNLMYSSSYEDPNGHVGASSWLVMVEKGEELTKDQALAKLALVESNEEQWRSLMLGGISDINGTGKVDVNDIQLVYDLYNGVYDSFETVSVRTFLLADQSLDRRLDSADAVKKAGKFYS